MDLGIGARFTREEGSLIPWSRVIADGVYIDLKISSRMSSSLVKYEDGMPKMLDSVKLCLVRYRKHLPSAENQYTGDISTPDSDIVIQQYLNPFQCHIWL